MLVTGTPRLALTVGSTGRFADYQSGSGTANLVFSYTVQSGENDTNGVVLGALELNGGAIADVVGNPAVLTLNSLPDTTSVKVDNVAPQVVSNLPGLNGTGVNLDANVSVTFSEAVTLQPQWAAITCANSGTHSAASTLNGLTYILNPTTNFQLGEKCTVTVNSASVTDTAGNPLGSNVVWSFTTASAIDALPEVVEISRPA